MSNAIQLAAGPGDVVPQLVEIETPLPGEDVFAFIRRKKGGRDIRLLRQILGAANDYREGDHIVGVAAASESSGINARALLAQTTVGQIDRHPLYEDEILQLIQRTTAHDAIVADITLGKLKKLIVSGDAATIQRIMPALSSDVVACLVKLMSNKELVVVGQKVFAPLDGSNIGSQGYLSARVQPNSPTDNPEDIAFQVFNAWSFAVGDLLLGTNPVSSEVAKVAVVEQTLHEILTVFGLTDVIPHSVLAHIDVQAAVETQFPGTTGIWFQSIGGTAAANRTFDVSVEKLRGYAQKRPGRYGFFFETGQGADFTNGHGEGFDMVVHEARKYGLIRALKQSLSTAASTAAPPWVFANDVAGFIGPEVFRTREQLVRCCLEDTVMGKLHGITIGLDICSTLHMDVSLDDLDWCIDNILPANPAYLMALPTKNDPMLGYLTTAFCDHVRAREKFGYRVDDTVWQFFRRIGIINANNRPSEHFGDPAWVYYQYCLAKGDNRNQDTILQEGRACISRVRQRGVPIAVGYGHTIDAMEPRLDKHIRHLYADAKVSIRAELTPEFLRTIPAATIIGSRSRSRADYIHHPESGETLRADAVTILQETRSGWQHRIPDVQIVISDGLNARAIMDDGHLLPFLQTARRLLAESDFVVGEINVVIINGRVRAGYACGEILFSDVAPTAKKAILHVIGERPGTGHHNFSAYLTVAPGGLWQQKRGVDHNISAVVSGISDTSLTPEHAAADAVRVIQRLHGLCDQINGQIGTA